MVGSDPRPDDPADLGAEVLRRSAQGRRLATDGAHRRRPVRAAVGVSRRLRRRRSRSDPVLPPAPARGPDRSRPRRLNTRLDGQRRDRKPLRRITSPRITLGVQPVQAAARQGPRGSAAAVHHPDQPRSLGGVPADQDDRRIPAGLDEVASPRPGPGHHGVLGLPAAEPARHRPGQRDSRLPAQERQDPRRRPRDLAPAHLLPQRHLGADGRRRRPDRQPLRPRARGHHRRRLPDAGTTPPQEKNPWSTTNPR